MFISACTGIQRQGEGVVDETVRTKEDSPRLAVAILGAEESSPDELSQEKKTDQPNSEESGRYEDKKPLWPTETGYATYYAASNEGLATASGEIYDPQLLTAAHKTIPIGGMVRVTNPVTQQYVIVRINDRWGGGGDRIINLSRQAAVELGFGSAGMVFVHLDVESAPLERDVTRMSRPVPLPERIGSDGTKQHSALSVCQNEAEILGLTGDFYRYHVLGCLARSK
ncbi:MAG: septal ring lytic transglycosylase RlpA family protein [Nitrosomonas sp.]|nr:septal ring lytic transglycosylase RlpA family protein [Nitrosomonas sp.]